jgi:hypothetical protein
LEKRRQVQFGRSERLVATAVQNMEAHSTFFAMFCCFFFFFFLLVFVFYPFLPSVTQCDAGTSQTTAAPETELHESIEEAVRAHERSQEHCSAPTRAKID